MRNTTARRILCISAVALAAGGCDSRGAVNFAYTVFADDAAIAAVDHAGAPWCADGSDPEVSVVATLAATVAQTSEQPGLTPAWREPLVEADLGAYRQGLSIDVQGRCGSDVFYMGRALMHPDAAMVRSRGVALGPIGNVTRLRLHFEATGGGGDDGTGATVDPAFGYGDDDYGWYDPAAGVDDPGYDWGDAPEEPGDDGSGDPGDCCSDGSGDPGDGWSDPGGDVGDSGGDSGDAGGDPGDSGADFRRAHRRRAVNVLRRR